MPESSEEPTYEVALSRLESLLDAMEEGQIPLGALVEKFAEGNQLLKVCERRLQEAELKIEQLSSGEGSPSFAPIDLPRDES
jgi:exodeoxyribonuclease VII small subunit